MMQYQGVVREVSSFDFNGKALWSFQLNGDKNYYRCGDKRPNMESGQYVTFEGNPGAKHGSVNVVKGSVQAKSGEKEASGVGSVGVATKSTSNGGVGKEDYWTNREARDIATQTRIERQSCRNSALEFIKILLSQEAVKFGAKADKAGILEEMLAKYTEEFIADNAGKKVEEKEPTETVVEDEVPY